MSVLPLLKYFSAIFYFNIGSRFRSISKFLQVTCVDEEWGRPQKINTNDIIKKNSKY